jgi:hypothetical protein
VSTDHLRTPEVRAKRTASRQANQAATRPTTRPGSETTNLRPGNPSAYAAQAIPAPTTGAQGGWR